MVRRGVVENGKIVNVVVADDETAKKNGWVIVPDNAEKGDSYVDERTVSKQEKIPQSVELRQLKKALRRQGLLSSVKTAVAALPKDKREDLEIDLAHMVNVDRSKAYDLLAGAINETMIDTLFIEGQNL